MDRLIKSMSVVAFSMLWVQISSSALIHCHKGEYYVQDANTHKEHCEPCKEGFYMDKDAHRETKCYRCDIPHGRGKIITQNCTNTTNTRIECDSDHYRVDQRKPNFRCQECKKCDVGEIVVIRCRGKNNTYCVKEEDCRLCSAALSATCGDSENASTSSVKPQSDTTVPTKNLINSTGTHLDTDTCPQECKNNGENGTPSAAIICVAILGGIVIGGLVTGFVIWYKFNGGKNYAPPPTEGSENGTTMSTSEQQETNIQ